ncbi:hypothetical protein EYC84_002582 [Monilinia fructicola]|uniref:Deacetylase sirtuin-type domain-containing protein n=1 Tax=Monilinia fructicola TaxID=38448 RepID=A0A5M9JPD9_MONFR|nr:hypothetical protein EYC84_002582 [Monilinia fructicola]
MGQEASQQQINPDDPPHTLSARSIEGIAKFIRDGQAKNIVVLTGAGISTSAGIPDFRSPETGLYANLAALDLPYAEAVFDIDFFRENPAPFYILAKELYPGKFYPTVSHAFVALLERKGLLGMLFTQNIDCLERRAGVSSEKIIEAHGSFASQRCIDCKTEYPDDKMKKAVEDSDPATCLVPQCGGLVKPDIVFFGEQLPEAFHTHKMIPATADLVIVMGTSLSVQPFATLPSLPADKSTKTTVQHGFVGGNTKQKEAERVAEARLNMSRDEILEADIENLTSEVEEALKISDNHTHRVNAILQKISNKSTLPPPTVEDLPTRPPAEVAANGGPLLADITNGIPLNKATTTVRSTPVIDENYASAKPAALDQKTVTEMQDSSPSALLDVTMPQHKPNSSKISEEV